LFEKDIDQVRAGISQSERAEDFFDEIPAQQTNLYQSAVGCLLALNGKCTWTINDSGGATLFLYGTYEFWDGLNPTHRHGKFCRRFPPELSGSGSTSCLRQAAKTQK
jgi:hypothetical protein